MSLVSPVGAVCKFVRYYLHIIGRIRRFLTRQACELLVHALVTSRMDMYNGPLIGLPRCLTNRIQRCQNVAAQIVTCEKRAGHITPTLGASTGFQSCTECSSRSCCTSVELYTACLLPISVSRCTPTHPAIVSDLLIATCFRFPGQRLNGVIGPSARLVHALWNDLPLRVRASPSLSIFKNRLKTLLFECAYT